MDRLTLALAGYESLQARLEPPAAASSPELLRAIVAASDAAEAWLRDLVCPAVEDVMQHRGFRLAARWSVDHLARGSNSPVRRLVQEADRLLVETARFYEELMERAPDPAAVTADLEVVRVISGRPWFDLVCPDFEYFYPQASLTHDGSVPVHSEAFSRRPDPRLPLGDFACRLMFERIAYWRECLDRAWYSVSRAEIAGWPSSEDRMHLLGLGGRLQQSVEQLRRACFSEPGHRQREAAVLLTQVYAGYCPAPDLDWLGPISSSARGSAGLIRSLVRRPSPVIVFEPDGAGRPREAGRECVDRCDPDVVRSVAAALLDARGFVEYPEDPDALIEWAARRARLVMADRFPRTVYFDGHPLLAGRWDTEGQSWDLLWNLALRPKQTVDNDRLTGGQSHLSRSRRSRLGTLLLEGGSHLDDLITAVRGRGYVLELDPSGVTLLREDSSGRLVSARPGTHLGP